jgi:hypothetical protein
MPIRNCGAVDKLASANLCIVHSAKDVNEKIAGHFVPAVCCGFFYKMCYFNIS